MNDLGNKYALAALKHKRGSLDSEIVSTERQLRHLKECLVHVDATLHILDPSIETDKLPNKRLPKRVKLFRQGELGRLIIDTIRRAASPIGTRKITDALLAAGGHGETARKAVAQRVRGNLAYQERRGKVVKSGSGTSALWRII